MAIMLCRLCLIKTNESINIFSEEKIGLCIAKFLQLELSPEDPISKIICQSCWEQLDSFESFCLQIDRAQKTLNNKIDTVPNANINSFQRLNGVKQEDQLEESNGDSSDNDDQLCCQDEDIVKVELHKDQEHKAKPANTTSSETKESIPIRRVTRRSVLKRNDSHNLSDLKEKRKRTDAAQVKKLESNKKTLNANKEEELEKITKDSNMDSNGKKKSTRANKSEQNNVKEKEHRSEKFLKAMQTSKEFDEIIRKHMNLSCDICSIQLSDFAELKQHFRIVHKRRGYAVCCNKRLNKRGLFVDHINVHNNPEYFKCTECGKILSDRICLHKHILSFHQTEELKRFQCEYCPKKFAKQYLLDQHSVKHVPQNEFTFICSECEKGFPTNSTLKAHLKQVHTTLYDRMCEICAKLIRGKAAFKRHVEEHEGVVHPQLQCTECGAWLKDKRNLRKHIVTQHANDDKNYSCDVCGKKAPSKGALQSHMRYVHQLSRIFKCTFCDKSFKKPDHLKEHMATHTGEVLYTCPYCPTTFNSRCNMYAHRKKKHREEWEANRALSKKEQNRNETKNQQV